MTREGRGKHFSMRFPGKSQRSQPTADLIQHFIRNAIHSFRARDMDSLGLAAAVVEKVHPGRSLPGVHSLPGTRSEKDTVLMGHQPAQTQY